MKLHTLNRWSLPVVALYMFISCSSYDNDLPLPTHERGNDTGFKVSEQEALKIATEAFGGTRAIANMKSEAIVSNSGTRSLPDTAAYVINVGNDEGFVIVSADTRMERILAFSDESSIDPSDTEHPVYRQFLKFIPKYKAYAIDSYDPANSNEDEYDPEPQDRYEYYVGPLLHGGKWHLYAPFNRYIPNHASPGCVALATAQIMMHCRNTLTYDSVTYNCPRILRAIRDSIVVNLPPIYPPIVGPLGSPDADINVNLNPPGTIMTYDMAVDDVAWLLHSLGTELNMNYGRTENASSSTFPIFAEYTFTNNGFNVYAHLQDYDANIMLDCLENHNCYIFICGSSYSDPDPNTMSIRSPTYIGGHAWVIDGCRYNGQWNMNMNALDVYDLQFHCDWGWGGRANGYYSSSIFVTHPYNMDYYWPTSQMDFMAIQRENV